MALKIRLRSQGRRNHIVFRLVLTDSRNPRDGKYIELLGHYDPYTKEENANVNAERILFWLNHGAELTTKAKSLVRRAAPEVITELQRRMDKTRAKVCAKRRELRKKRETAAV